MDGNSKHLSSLFFSLLFTVSIVCDSLSLISSAQNRSHCEYHPHSADDRECAGHSSKSLTRRNENGHLVSPTLYHYYAPQCTVHADLHVTQLQSIRFSCAVITYLCCVLLLRTVVSSVIGFYSAPIPILPTNYFACLLTRAPLRPSRLYSPRVTTRSNHNYRRVTHTHIYTRTRTRTHHSGRNYFLSHSSISFLLCVSVLDSLQRRMKSDEPATKKVKFM